MKQFLFLFLIVLLVSSCRSAKEEYNKGKYESAIKKSLKELRSDQKSRESKSIYNKALVKYENNILKEYKRINTVEAKESIYNSMNVLIDYYSEGQEFLDTFNVRRNIEMIALSDAVKGEIIDEYYQRGRNNLALSYERDDKSLAQLAYNDFYKLRDRYNPKISELGELIEESLLKGTTIIIFQTDVNFNTMEQNEIESKFSQLEGSSGFTRVYVNRGPDKADCVIELDFERLKESQSTSSETRDFQKRVEDGFTLEKDDKGNPIQVPRYIYVSGSVTIKTVRYTLSWDVSADAHSMSRHCQRFGQNFTTERYHDEVSYIMNGDVSTIPSEYKNKRPRRYDKRNMVNDLMDDLYDEVRKYYL